MTDPLWYKDAVFYELHVKAFQDSNADGIGDFAGLLQRLDYLQDLGVDCLWLLPFYPSPLRDDGYDIADYCNIHPAYGTLEDFQRFLDAAHARGIRVIADLVLNHTSDQHPWFQRARRAPKGSPERAWYVWSDTDDRYREARIIFLDTESSNWAWDPVAGQYYWHRFYSHQPDLNWDNPDVKRAMLQVIDFWLARGLDGFRADAVPYLIEREGTNCENLPETHAVLKEIRAHIDAHFPGRILLAEANQWPEDVRAYFGDGDEFHMAFHFPLMPRIFMAVRQERRTPIVEIVQRTPPIPDPCQWALFLRNHDELTLEMVTDEERDYMYREYARDPQMRLNLGIRRRLAPLLDNDRRKIELLNSLLFTLPGSPILYYGDEIGMGDNIYLGDRNGVRTPMQWSPDRNAGFSRADPARLYLPVIADSIYGYPAVNVEAQLASPFSLLNWTKRLIQVRKQHPVLGRGRIEFLYPENPHVLAFLRSNEEETLLLVHNLAGSAQPVLLDLQRFAGCRPVELLGATEFYSIGSDPYPLTLAPYGYLWFALRRADAAREAVRLPGAARQALDAAALARLGATIPVGWLTQRRWCGGKGRPLTALEAEDAAVLGGSGEGAALLALLRVGYGDGEPERYWVGLLTTPPRPDAEPWGPLPLGDTAVPLFAAEEPGPWARALVEAIAGERTLSGVRGRLQGHRRARWVADSDEVEALGVEASNTLLRIGDGLLLKVLRRFLPGEHAELELWRALEDRGFRYLPPLYGWIDYAGRAGEGAVALLAGYVPHEGDGWTVTQAQLRAHLRTANDPTAMPAAMAESLGALVELGRVVGALHRSLASLVGPDLAPESITEGDVRRWKDAARARLHRVFGELRRLAEVLPGFFPAGLQEDLQAVLGAEGYLAARFDELDELEGLWKTRIHGDFHLGQALRTPQRPGGWTVIDLEGPPALEPAVRRAKASPLRDLAGLRRSLDYARRAALRDLFGDAVPEAPDRWALAWEEAAWEAFLGAYEREVGVAAFLPVDRGLRRRLIDVFALDKAIYELGYELRHRPDWVALPLRALRERWAA